MKTKFKKAIILLTLCAISAIILIFSIKTVKAEENQTDMNLKVETNLEKYINYDIAENDKETLVQFNINTQIAYGEEKKHIPFKETETIISLEPIEEKYPNEVKVIEKRTEITNGKVLNKEANYEYDKNTGKVTIKANNINENGELIYSGKPEENAKDEYIVICYYDTFSTEKPSRDININVRTKAILNTEENKEIVGEQKLEENVTENIGEMTSIKYNTEDVYNGNIKSNIINKTEYGTVYKEKEEIVISKKEAQEKLKISEDNSFLKVHKNEEEETVSEIKNKKDLVYKSTKFSKDNLKEILGEEGKVEILDQENNIIFTIDKNSTFEEDGTITVNYQEDTEKIIIKTSNILKEGILEIGNTKEIKNTMLDAENIRIRTNSEIEGIKEEKILSEKTEEIKEITTFKNSEENFTDIKEAKTDVKLDINNTKWTNKEQNEVEFNIYLKAENINNNMFKNPSIKINLPEEVEKVILKDTSLVYGNGLELEQPYVEKAQNGNISIIANLKGSQTQYNEGSDLGLATNIKISTNVILKKDIQTATTNIDMEYSNEYNINNKKEIGNQNIEIQLENYREEKPLEEPQEEQNNEAKEEQNQDKTSNEENKTENTVNTENEENIENAKKVQLEVSPTKGETKINEGDTLYEGEFVKYNIKIKNTSDKKIENLKIEGKIAEGTTYGELEADFDSYAGKYEYNFNKELKTKEINVGTIKPGETKTFFYEVQVNDLAEDEEEKNTKSDIGLYAENTKIKNYEINNKIEKADAKIFVYAKLDNGTNRWNYGVQLKGEEEKEVTVYLKFPEEFTLKWLAKGSTEFEDVPSDRVTVEADNTVKATLKIDNNLPYVFEGVMDDSEIDKNNDESVKRLFTNTKVIVDGKTYTANETIAEFKYKNASITMSSPTEGEEIKYGDIVEYEINVKNISSHNYNTGEYRGIGISLTDYLPEEIKPISVTYETWELEIKDTVEETTYRKVEKTEDIDTKRHDAEGNLLPNVDIFTYIPEGETAKIKVKATAGMVYEKTEIENFATITSDKIETEGEKTETSSIIGIKNSNIIKHTILPYDIDIKPPIDPDKPVDPDRPVDPDKPINPDKPVEPENPDKPQEEKHEISGTAWLDENEDGKRQNDEGILTGITVMLVDMKDSSKVKEKTETRQDGTYTFTNVPNGNYVIIFMYDTNNYRITTYSKNGVENISNSDVSNQEIKLNGIKMKVAATDVLKLNNDISNIDIGLIRNKVFDLHLDKTISKVTVQTKNQIKETKYDNTKLAKVEIKSKELEGAKLTVEYKIKVTNEGEIRGTANSIVDYLPEGFELSKVSNNTWKKAKNGEITNDSLTSKKIEPGESQTVTLVLTKNLTGNNIGQFTNKAEIKESSNESQIRDIDSVAYNKEEKEDDFSKADIIISISTGMIVYISIGMILTVLIIIALLIARKKGKLNKIFKTFTIVMILGVTFLTTNNISKAGYAPEYTNFSFAGGVNGTYFYGGPYDVGGWCINSDPPTPNQDKDPPYYTSYYLEYEGDPTLISSYTEKTGEVELTKLNEVIGLKNFDNNNYLLGPFSVSCNNNNIHTIYIKDRHGNLINNWATCDQYGNGLTAQGSITFYIKMPKANVQKGISSIKLVNSGEVTSITYKTLSLTATYAPAVIPGTQKVQSKPFTVTDQENTTTTDTKEVEWTTINGGLEIVKRDADDADVKLEGVEIRVEGIQSGYNQTFKTDANGRILIDNLEVGMYRITEVANGHYGYQEVEQDLINIFQGMIHTYNLTNTKNTGNLKITKKDPDSGKYLSGIGFKIKDSNGNYIIAVDQNKVEQKKVVGTIYLGDLKTTSSKENATEFVTNSNGLIEIYNILKGTYTVEEVSVGDNIQYEIDDKYIYWESDKGSGNGHIATVEVERQKSYDTTPNNNVINDSQKIIADGIYEIESALDSNMVVDVENGYGYDQTNVYLYERNNSTPQKFYIKYLGNGEYTINAVINNKCLDVYGAGTTPGTNVHIWTPNNSTAQRWRMIEQGNGYYSIISQVNGLALDVYNGETANQTNIQVSTINNSNAQKFKFNEISNSESGTNPKDNKNNILNVYNRRKYVDLSGIVWEDIGDGKQTYRNNLYDTKEPLIEGMTVTLYEGNKTVRTAITDRNGKYLFKNVEIDKLSKYYISFEYNGMSYECVPKMLNQTNGSKATEGNSREIFNNKFAEIKKGEAIGTNGGKTPIEYNKNNSKYESIVNLGKPDQNGKKPYYGVYEKYEITSNTYNAYNGYLDKIKTAEEVRKQDIKEIANINLGIFLREQPNASLIKDINNVKVSINGQTHTYNYRERYNNSKVYTGGKELKDLEQQIKFQGKYSEMTYTRPLYASDISYDGSKELSVKVIYEIGIINKTTNLKMKIPQIYEYFDSKYELRAIGRTLDKNGYVNNDKSIGRKQVSNKDDYKGIEISTNIVVEPQKEEKIYIELEVLKNKIVDILDGNTEIKLDNVAEIGRYGTLDANGKVYAGIDSNSEPGNANPADQKTYEDDTDRAPGFSLVLQKNPRKINGKVFLENIETSENPTTVMTGEERKGNGQYDNDEKGIKDVEVRLVYAKNPNEVAKIYDEETKTYTKEAIVKTNSNGDFEISGFIPEDYELRYTWGNKEYKVQNYKGTAIDESTWNKNEQNNEWYKTTEPRYSDAIDNYETRKAIDKQTEKINNANMNIINNYVEGSKITLKDGTEEELITKMNSNTQDFKTHIEYDKDNSNVKDEFETNPDGSLKLDSQGHLISKDEFKNTIKNIDFGLIERPKQQLKLEKHIKQVRITLANGVILVDAKVEKGPDGKYQLAEKTPYTVYLPKSNVSQGAVKIEVDQELIEGAKLDVIYEITINNVSELDYVSEKYYKFGIGKENPVRLKASIIDYLDDNLIMTDKETADKWNKLTLEEKKELFENGSLDKNLQEYVEKLKSVQTHINEKPLKAGEQTKVELETSKLLSKNDEIIIGNDTEVIEIDKTGGKTPEPIPGNFEPSTNKPNEPDDDTSEEIIILPPTGTARNTITYIMLGISTLGILTAGIILIKKYVLKK